MPDARRPDDKLVMLEVGRVTVDFDLQSRTGLDDDALADLAFVLESGGELPPVLCYFDGAKYWLASGFHRVEAHRRAGSKFIATLVRQGDRAGARLCSAGCNLRWCARRW